MKFNYSLNSTNPGSVSSIDPDTGEWITTLQPPYPVEPEYDRPYGACLPPVQARGNLSYLQFIDLLCSLWSDGHPDIKFGPFGAHRVFNPESGYLIYSLEDKKPKANNPRPRFYEVVDDVLNPNQKVAVFIENFNLIVSFSAVHKDPRTAEEMMEAFEDFMIEYTPVFKSLGLEQLTYVRRMPDAMEKRFGDDVAARSIAYMLGVQKILTIPLGKLEAVYIEAQVRFERIITGATPNYEHATPSDVKVRLLDNNMTL